MASMNKKNAGGLDANTIRVRMYRVGFGDCFLVSLPVNGGADTHAHILIDCGVHAKGDLNIIDRAVSDIAKTTKKNLAIIIATHSHQDHISGFGNAFTQFKIGEVWLPWCENLKDAQATKLHKKHTELARQLQDHFAAAPRSTARDPERQSAMAAVLNLVANKNAMSLLRSGFGVNANVRYLEAGGSLKNPAGIEGLSVRVLGPPRDPKFLAKMDPPTGQRYMRLSGGHIESVNDLQPFNSRWRVKANDRSLRHLRLSNKDQKSIQAQLVEASLNGLAFTLDQARNNTSLVSLITYRGQRMLFPGDAQYGNWKSWLDQDDAESILSGVTFFKVAHHGSHNATPRDALERMSKGKFAAMVSTQNVPWDTIPRLPLLKRLSEQTNKRVVRSDSLVIADRPKAPEGPAVDPLPRGFQKGDFWYDYLVKV